MGGERGKESEGHDDEGEQMKLKGKISISRPFYGDGKKGIEITIIDDTSGCEFLSASMTMESFAECLTGLGHTECDLEFRETAPIGKICEVKEEIVPKPKGYKDRGEAVKLLAPFETEGWKGRIDDMFNHRRWSGTNHVRVTFVRYVDKEAE